MRRLIIILIAAAAGTVIQWIPVERTFAESEPDDVQILARYDFEDGFQGWHREEWAEYKPWNEVALTDTGTFQGSRQSLKTTSPNTWSCLGPLADLEFTAAGTKISFAYYGHHCSGVAAQGWNVELDTNVHFTIMPYADGEWQTATAEFARFVTWSGTGPAAGSSFRTVQVYANSDKKFSDNYFLLDNIVVYTGTDRTPPARVTGVSAQVNPEQGTVQVAWQVPADNVGAALFRVFRSTAADFTPDNRTLIGTTTDAEYSDTTLPNFGTFYYRVVALDYAGNAAAPSEPCPVQVIE